MHRFNVKRDTPDSGDKVARPIMTSLPARVDLREWMPPVTDQGQEGSCTAHAGVAILAWLFRRYKNESPIFSPTFLYRAERLIEGDPGQDGGAQSRTMVAVLCYTGVCLASTLPYNDHSYADPTTMVELAEAQKYRAGAFHRVTSLDILRSVLASGYVASLAINVFPSFESDAVAQTGVVPMPGPQEQSLGGHEVVCCGYDDEAQTLLVRNSWGASWGNAGSFTLPYAYWANVFDSWVAHFGGPWL